MRLPGALSLPVVLPAFLVSAFGSPSCTVQTGAGNADKLYTSPALESLRCYNDFKSHILCSWTESEQMHLQDPLSLFHWKVNESIFPTVRESPCLPYGPAVPLLDGRVTVHCRYNTSLFALGLHDAFFFKKPCPPGLSKTITPIHHVRPGPPRSLSQRATEGGAVVLKWRPPLHTPSSPSLNYQVSYRRSGGAWTEVQVSEPELNIEAESLVPDCEYEAKVRGRQNRGPWSEWSPLLVWKTKNVPGAARLQCVFDGQVHCSWEVQRSLAEFITYRLSYQPNQTAPARWCAVSSPLDEQASADSVLRFSCSFSVSDPKLPLLVELHPAYNAKPIFSPGNIQPSPPDPVKVTEKGEDWVLSWTPPDSPVSMSYQLQYWSTEEQENVEMRDLAKGARHSVITGVSLQPSTRYRARVRALVIRTDFYNGPFSEWSQWVEWTTHSAPWSTETLVYIFISVFMAMVFIFLYFTLPACRRRIVLWKVSVPTPIKSKVLEEIMKRNPSAKPALQKDMEKTLICSVQVLDKINPPSFPEDCCHPPELAYCKGSGPCWDKDPKSADLGPPVPPQEGSLSFSGPYILCHDSPPPESRSTDEQACLRPLLFETPFPAPLQGYVGAPPTQDVQEPPAEGGLARDGYVTGPCVLMKDPQPEPDSHPPPYTLTPVPLPEFGAYPPMTVLGRPAGGEGSGGWPEGSRQATDYVRLSETAM